MPVRPDEHVRSVPDPVCRAADLRSRVRRRDEVGEHRHQRSLEPGTRLRATDQVGGRNAEPGFTWYQRERDLGVISGRGFPAGPSLYSAAMH